MGLAITVNTDITFINQTNTRKVHTACANILALPEAPVSGAFLLPEEGCILNKKRTAAIIVAAILGLASLLYLGGVLGQLQENYEIWIASGGITGQAYIQPVNWMPGVCFRKACSIQGIKSKRVCSEFFDKHYLISAGERRRQKCRRLSHFYFPSFAATNQRPFSNQR